MIYVEKADLFLANSKHLDRPRIILSNGDIIPATEFVSTDGDLNITIYVSFENDCFYLDEQVAYSVSAGHCIDHNDLIEAFGEGEYEVE